MNSIFYVIGLFAVAISCVSCTGGQILKGVVGDNWTEEVQLHDGTVMIINRSQSYKGFHEIGQSTPVGQHTVNFKITQTGKTYSWASDYSDKLGRTNFKLLAVHVLNGIPYIVATPNLCLAYNTWGRPNPPYILFKNTDNSWKRIELAQFPREFTSINVLIEPTDKDMQRSDPISVKEIKEKNIYPNRPEYQYLARLPVTKGSGLINCPDWSAERHTNAKAPVQ